MANPCSPNSSIAKTGIGPIIVYDAAKLVNLFTLRGIGWLSPYLPAIGGQNYDLNDFCGNDPPSPTTGRGNDCEFLFSAESDRCGRPESVASRSGESARLEGVHARARQDRRRPRSLQFRSRPDSRSLHQTPHHPPARPVLPVPFSPRSVTQVPVRESRATQTERSERLSGKTRRWS